FGVTVMTPAEYRVAIAASLEAEHDLAAFYLEVAEHFRGELGSQGSATGWIPDRRWGDAFFLARIQGGRLGMDRLARIVSQVERCTRNDIKAIESAEAPPEDMRLSRVALCMAVALDFDPIYMRFQLGIARWDCDVELEELE